MPYRTLENMRYLEALSIKCNNQFSVYNKKETNSLVASFRESISLENYLEGKPNVNVTNIVKMDGNKVYSTMEDPEGVFGDKNPVNMMASSGDVLMIITSYLDVFTWDSVNYFQHLYSLNNTTTNLSADSNGNFFALTQGYYSDSIYLAFFNASNGYQGLSDFYIFPQRGIHLSLPFSELYLFKRRILLLFVYFSYSLERRHFDWEFLPEFILFFQFLHWEHPRLAHSLF